MTIQFKTGDALLIVDAQIDFFPDGALGVPEGDQIIPILNEMIVEAQKKNIPILASRDWHPANHISFKVNGGIWPVHCVQGTRGAEFDSRVNIPSDAVIINKGFDNKAWGYSAFEGKTEDGTPLAEALKELGIKRIWIGGLAFDYCVRMSVVDGTKSGLEINVVLAATRSIDTSKQQEIVDEIKSEGGNII